MKRARPGWLLLALAGLAAVFGAFLPFYTYANGIDVTVWSRGLFPTAALIPLLGFAVSIEAVVVLIRGHEPRSPFLNFTWEQVRLAVGAFMILLTLSYLLQDRAGGTLGLGYVLLSVSSLATFGGGVLTRRAQLARVPGEAVPEPEHREVIRPALASVSRASGDLVKNVGERGRHMRVRLAERREERAVAKREAAEQAAARRAETQAAAEKAAAEKAAAEEAATERAAAERAAAERAAAEKVATEKVAREKAAAEKAPAKREQPAPPTATVDTLPSEPLPPAATLAELPAEETAEQPPPATAPADSREATKPFEATSPVAEERKDTEDTAELPLAADSSDADDDKTTEQHRVAKLSAVPSDNEPDATPPPDGDSGNRANEEEEKERADTGTEGSPSS